MLTSLFASNVPSPHSLYKRDSTKHNGLFIAEACLIPVLVILSGIFAGLTLGYMSLDETQLNVLSTSGTQKQKEYANKIKPIRKNGHLLLVTLLLANMITNETLPVISDPVFGGGVPAVIGSTALIVIFAEIIPQSVCTRHGLYIGAKMAGTVRLLMLLLGVVAWPVAKLLEIMLGPHHGIIYRRAELKELIAMHASVSPHGGDLRQDTVTIIGATLDLQEKVVRQAMTPIEDVFMLSINARLDYETLRRICLTGHSRVPVYEEIDVNIPINSADPAKPRKSAAPGMTKVKRIIGILLVKQCVLLDPQDAVPVRKLRLNKVPFVPQNEPLLGILDRFQEGRSHMAIVSRISAERAQSVKKAVKKGLTQRLRDTVMGDSDSSESSDDDSDDATKASKGDNEKARRGRKNKAKRHANGDLEMGDTTAETLRTKKNNFVPLSAKEQSMPADAVLTRAGAEEYIQTQGIDPAVMPLGIITLEDVLEELIGEEIYDEFDAEGAHSQTYEPPMEPDPQDMQEKTIKKKLSAPELAAERSKASTTGTGSSTPTPGGLKASLAMPRPIALPSLKTLGFLRSRSAPPTPRDISRATSTMSPQVSASGSVSNAASGSATPRRSIEGGGPAPSPLSLTTPAVVMTSPDGDAKPLSFIVENPSPPSSLTHSPAANEENPHSDGGAAEATPPLEALVRSPSAQAGSPGYPFPVPNSGLASPPAATPTTAAAAAPLEAILLDRKRRAQMQLGQTGASTPTGSKPGTPGVKSKGFKSNPISGAAAGVVVAEQIKKEQSRTGSSIPNERDKVGPDKDGEGEQQVD